MMIGAMYEVQLVEDRQRELFAEARAYRRAKLARDRRRARRARRDTVA
jgi:hypothetical protein